MAQTEYSADMIQSGADGRTTSGKIYVGKQGTRTEMDQAGQKVISIINMAQKKSWLIYPSQQSYMEWQAPPAEGMTTGAKPDPRANPCAGMSGMTCKKAGTETVHGRKATKWEMTATHQGQTMNGTVWIDVERGVPLRQQMPGGQMTEMRMLGTESLGGRTVEKWEMVSSGDGTQSQTSYQWYDPALEQSIRQEFPGGFVSELKNIQVGPQPTSLFQVPAGYKKMDPPQGQQSPSQ
jgi:hypothetical protein